MIVIGIASALPCATRAQTLVDPRPRDGMSTGELNDFYAGLALFKQQWTQTANARNEDQCADCHFRPALGGNGFVYHANVWHAFTYAHASRELGVTRYPASRGDTPSTAVLFHFEGENAPIPSWENAMSRRVARTLFGEGSIEQIPQSQILAKDDPNDADGDGISGRALGRFGTQGQFTSIDAIVREVITNEVGVAPVDVRSEDVRQLAAFIRGLRDPIQSTVSVNVADGQATFVNIGCASCHAQQYSLPSGRKIRPYSDFLVHDMGPCLDDGVALGAAKSYEWRTPPLWGVNDNGANLLHDGRGARLEQALPFHCGEATPVREAFYQLSEAERGRVKLFLQSLLIDY